MTAYAEFDYYKTKIQCSGPTWTAVWSGLKYFCGSFQKDYIELNNEFNLHRKKSFLDIGACIGVFSMLFSLGSPEAKVVAYEPSSTNYPHLVKNMEKYPNVTCYKKAVSSYSGEIQIALPTLEQKTHTQGVVQQDNPGIISVYGKSDIYKEVVPCVKLDDEDVVAEFIKMDVEGHEIDVIGGARNLIENCRPIIMLEYHKVNAELAGYVEEDYKKLFREIGYNQHRLWGHDLLIVPR